MWSIPSPRRDAALDFVRTHPVDLAILDIKLQKMSGIEVLRLMKQAVPDMHAIMLTGYPTVETARGSGESRRR